MNLFTCLTESVDTKFTPAGEDMFTGGTLQTRVGGVEVDRLLEVGPHPEAPVTRGAGVAVVSVAYTVGRIL